MKVNYKLVLMCLILFISLIGLNSISASSNTNNITNTVNVDNIIVNQDNINHIDTKEVKYIQKEIKTNSTKKYANINTTSSVKKEISRNTSKNFFENESQIINKTVSSIKKGISTSNVSENSFDKEPDFIDEKSSCCSVVVHVSDKESVISFRRDSSYQSTIHIINTTWHGVNIVKQYKNTNGYFVHTISTANGWVMGFGGADNVNIQASIVSAAGTMFAKNNITTNGMNNIYNLLKKLTIGHTVIKAPDGRIGVAIYNTKYDTKGNYFVSKLNNGEFVCVPNSVHYYHRGVYSSYNKDPLLAAIYIAGYDKYGYNRRNVITYHTSCIGSNQVVKIYASDDNGKLANKYCNLRDPINCFGKYISTSSIPILPKKISIGSLTFNKIASKIIMNNIINNGSKTMIKAVIQDINGNIIKTGKVAFKLNGKTIKTVQIKNNIATVTTDISNYNTKNYTITAVYGGDNYYKSNRKNSILTINKYIAYIKINPIVTNIDKTVQLTAYVTDKNNKSINNGKITFKLNGKTLKDRKGNVLYSRIINGVASINYTIPSNLMAKTYDLTVVGSGKSYNNLRNNTNITINKINTHIQVTNITTIKNTTVLIAKILKENNQLIKDSTKIAIKINGKTVAYTKSLNGIINTTLNTTKYASGTYNLMIVTGEGINSKGARITTILNKTY